MKKNKCSVIAKCKILNIFYELNMINNYIFERLS